MESGRRSSGRGGVYLPLHRLGISLQEQVSLGQLLPQASIEGTQIGQSLSLAAVRPKEKGNMSSWLRMVAVQEQINKEALLAWAVDGSDGTAVIRKLKISKKLNLYERHQKLLA